MYYLLLLILRHSVPFIMAGQQVDARFLELLKSLRERLHVQEIRCQLRAGGEATFSAYVARFVADNAGKFVHFLPHPAGLALQSLLFLAEFGLQALENTAEAASLQDKVQDVQQQLLRLCMDLGSVPDDIQHDINRITETLLKVSVVLDDLRRPASGWRKCTSCLRVVLCAKCDAQKLQGVAADLNTVLNQISSTLNRILARRIGRPAEAAPELPAHLDKGMDGRVTKVMEFLRTSTNQSVRVVGLHGEGGIGKTTLMHAIHNQLKRDPMPQQAHKIGYVEVGMTPRFTTELQESLYEQLSGGDKLRLSSAAQGKSELRGLLAKLQKPVSIFIDNVWESQHLEDLLPGELFNVLPGGSYMLISSRSGEVAKRLGQMCFKSKEEEEQGYMDYQLELLGKEDAMELFLENASRGEESRPLSKEDALVKAMVPLCGGLPLALAVYGAFFKDESKREPNAWERVYKRMRETGDPSTSSKESSVFNKLKLSVNFQSPELQDAFLDIALFFNRNYGFGLDAVKYALKEEDYLEILVDQSLVRVEGEDDDCEVVVHDVLVLVARKMAEERSIAASTLTFEHDDPLPDQMQVRFFDVRKWPRSINYPSPSQMKGCRYLILDGWELDFFLTTIAKHCRSIRLLQLGSFFLGEPHFTEHVFPWLANLKELTVLFSSAVATSFHITSLPKICFQLWLFTFEQSDNAMFPNSFLKSSSTSLRRISMHSECLAQLPPEIGRLAALTRLDLSECGSLAQLPPEIGGITTLTRLDLHGCESLVQLPSEIGRLAALTRLDLSECGSLVQLPPKIGGLAALTRLDLRGCRSLAQLPPEIGALTALTRLDLSGCESLVQLPSEIKGLAALMSLDLHRCESLVQLPPEIGGLAPLMNLDLSGCGSLVQLPLEIGGLAALTSLDLSGCGSLAQLPLEIGGLASLTVLDLHGCRSLAQLPSEIGGLMALTSLDLCGCESLSQLPPEIRGLAALTSLDLTFCESMAQLPSEIGELTALTHLYLSECESLTQLPQEIRRLTALMRLDLSGCGSLAQLPPEIGGLAALTRLDLHGCKSLVQLPPEMGGLALLTSLDLSGCGNLAQLPPEIGGLAALTSLNLSGCGSLTQLPPEIGCLVALTSLDLSECKSLAQLPSTIGGLSALTSLDLNFCESLLQLPPEIEGLTALTHLDLHGCKSLMQLPSEIGGLTALTRLDLRGCGSLVQRPPEIGGLTALTRLDLLDCGSLTQSPQRSEGSSP